jgi:ABC-type Mn2+/Zn2+ transport system ATPase subunit
MMSSQSSATEREPGVEVEPEAAMIEVQGVTVAYNGKPALENLSVRIPAGDRVALVGPNGAGKTTLFKAIIGLLPLREGRILIHGLPHGSHVDCVAYVPQREEVDWRFPVTVGDVVMMGRYGRLGRLRRPGARDKAIVAAGMEEMGIGELADRPISMLSGGQQQRAFLARALAQEPHVMLFDEPFTGVDAPTQATTLDLLDRLHQRRVTVLASTHDLSLASTRFERILLMNRRVIAYGPPAEVLTQENITNAFQGKVLRVAGSLVVDHCVSPHDSLEKKEKR